MCFCRKRTRETKKLEKQYKTNRFTFYSPAELQADASKKETEGYAFVTNPDAPVLLVIPGGAYRGIAIGHEGIHFAKELNKRGYNAFVLRYRVYPNAKAPNPQDDLGAFVRYIFENKEKFGFTADKYGLVGFSAGGHLAASFGLSEIGYAHYEVPRPSVEILGYPVITMGEGTNAGTKESLLGKGTEKVEEYSVEKRVDGSYPPTFVWCCNDDKSVSPQNSKMLCQSLMNAGVTCVSAFYGIGGHGIGLGQGTSAEGWLNIALRFADAYL